MSSSSEDVSGADPLIGRVIASRYRLEKKLGAGAMGSVYRARHVKIDRAFAIKILHVEMLVNPKLQRRFQREAELAGTLSHPNIVTVLDVGELEGLHYIAMEYAEGPTLSEILTRSAPLPTERVIALATQICDGLHHAHERGLIHRDFKPDNVIVEPQRDGRESARIVDFGIAIVRDDASSEERERLTTAGITLGTPHYMAPEHVTGQAIDHRIDLFALGVVLYEMLCAALPFEGDGVDVARANLLEETPYMAERSPGVKVDALLEAFTRKLLSKSPDARPATAKAARELLDLIATDRPRAAAALGVIIDADAADADDDDAPAATPVITPPPLAARPVPRYASFTPPTPYLPVPQPITYSPSGQHAIVGPDPTGPVPVYVEIAPSEPVGRARIGSGSGAPRTRSPRVSQAPLPRDSSPILPSPSGQYPVPTIDTPATGPHAIPTRAPTTGPHPIPIAMPLANTLAPPKPRAHTESANRVAVRRHRMWIVIALGALALGAVLALLLA